MFFLQPLGTCASVRRRHPRALRLRVQVDELNITRNYPNPPKFESPRPAAAAELPLANSVRRCASVALTGAPWPSTSTPSSISSRLNFWDALCLVSGVSSPPSPSQLTLCAALRFARPSTAHCTLRPEAQGGCRTGLGRAACALGFEAPATGAHWSTLVHLKQSRRSSDEMPYASMRPLAPQAIQPPQPLYRDPATTWSNGYELC